MAAPSPAHPEASGLVADLLGDEYLPLRADRSALTAAAALVSHTSKWATALLLLTPLLTLRGFDTLVAALTLLFISTSAAVKLLVGAPRPATSTLAGPRAYGMPSSDAGSAAFVAGILVACVWRCEGSMALVRDAAAWDDGHRAYATAAAAAAVLLVGLARHRLGHHTLAQVVAGWALGAALAPPAVAVLFAVFTPPAGEDPWRGQRGPCHISSPACRW